jgi:sulfite reductase alpha subunit-like flavoprotein
MLYIAFKYGIFCAITHYNPKVNAMKKLLQVSVLLALSSSAYANCDDSTKELQKYFKEHNPEGIFAAINADIQSGNRCFSSDANSPNAPIIMYMVRALDRFEIPATPEPSDKALSTLCRNAAWKSKQLFIPMAMWVKQGTKFVYVNPNTSETLTCGIYKMGNMYISAWE